MAHQINSKTARDALPLRREQYWHALGRGKHVGYRKMTAGTNGTWFARLAGVKPQRLGELAGIAEGKRFEAACEAAQAWFAETAKLAPDAQGAALTIAQACENYVLSIGDKAREKRKSAAEVERAMKAVRQRHAMLVLDRPAFASAPIRTLTAQDFKAWRRHISTMPTASKSNRGNARSQATINRDLTVLRAALNLAHKDRLVPERHAWQEALAPIADADTGRARKFYLKPDQRAKLVASAANEHDAAFIAAIAQLPFRPGVVAALTVKDYDAERSIAHLGWDKGHPPRSVQLPPEQAALFAAQCKGKTPAAPLFANKFGDAWHSDSWKRPLKDAVLAAGLPRGSTMYTLRHSVITDLIKAGVDVASVAKYAGTSILMIERNYHKMLDGQSVAELAMLKLPALPVAAAA